MGNRFDYIEWDQESKKKADSAKELMLTVEQFVTNHLMDGRAKSIVLTGLEEVHMWMGKAIRDEQLFKINQSHKNNKG